jgi:nucleoside phosphorylase
MAQPQAEHWPAITEEDRDLPADVVIITPLEDERDAVLGKLKNQRKLNPGEDIRVYYLAKLPVTFPEGQKTTYRVVVTDLAGMGEVEASIATGHAITRWEPRVVLLVGIAGGVAENGVQLGDILIADQIAYYELQKLTPEGPQIRWRMMPTNPRLLGAARNFSAEAGSRLLTTPRPVAGKPARHIGPIATGDKVIAEADLLDSYRRQALPKLIGVEMEAWGVASAAFQSGSGRQFFMVRGVSDLADPAKDSPPVDQWRSYACDAAASYAIALLQSGPLPNEQPEKA